MAWMKRLKALSAKKTADEGSAHKGHVMVVDRSQRKPGGVVRVQPASS